MKMLVKADFPADFSLLEYPRAPTGGAICLNNFGLKIFIGVL